MQAKPGQENQLLFAFAGNIVTAKIEEVVAYTCHLLPTQVYYSTSERAYAINNLPSFFFVLDTQP